MASEVLDLFLELAASPSPSGEEREVADRVIAYLAGLRARGPTRTTPGRASARRWATSMSRLEPTAAGEPLFLCAHLDTVPPTDAIEPVVEDGVVRNARPTILGGDNKAAVAAMLEATRRVLAENRPHAGIELVFTPKEEVGLLGAYAFDHTRLRARVGYVYDQAAPIGDIVLGAPSAQQLEITSTAAPRTPGCIPEEGRSAIAAAARAISEMRLGRIDEETTANVGEITGGTAREHRPGVVLARRRGAVARRAEARRPGAVDAGRGDLRRRRRRVRGRDERRAAATAPTGSSATTSRCGSPRTALARCGFEPSYGLSGGAADANVFNERGLQCVNLANGMAEIHTPDESIAVADLDAMVEVTLALVDAAAA